MSKQHICTAEDDNGKLCGTEVDAYQWKQDGMCSRCASAIWNSLQTGEPVIFEEK